MTDHKQYNELAARLQRVETLLESNDAYQPPGAVTLADLDMGPGYDSSVPPLESYYQNGVQWDQQWDPAAYADWQDQQSEVNDGFAQSQSTIDDLLSRLNAVETFLSGGSNDTNQSGALDWGSTVGDDGQTGTGDAGGIPTGYGPVSLQICDSGVSKTMTVIGTTPA